MIRRASHHGPTAPGLLTGNLHSGVFQRNVFPIHITHVVVQCAVVGETSIGGQRDILLFPLFIECLFAFLVQISLFDLNEMHTLGKKKIERDVSSTNTNRNSTAHSNFAVFVFIV